MWEKFDDTKGVIKSFIPGLKILTNFDWLKPQA